MNVPVGRAPKTAVICDTSAAGRAILTIAAARKGYRVVGVCWDYRHASVRAAMTSPTVVILPLEPIELRQCLEAIASIKSTSPSTAVICVVDRWDNSLVAEAYLAGADAAVLRTGLCSVIEHVL
jgi:AmiR/NasT family two-component response regulator